MPSFIVADGTKYYRPATYVSVSDSTQQEANVAGGDVCVVGDFPLFQVGIPYVFSTNNDLQNWLTPSLVGDKKVKFLKWGFFRPSANSTNSPSSLTIVNTRPNTQAFLENGGLKIKSKFWGKEGRTLSVKFSQSGEDNSLSVERSGVDVDLYSFTSTTAPITFTHSNVVTGNRPVFTSLDVEVSALKLKLSYSYPIGDGNTTNFNLPHEGIVTTTKNITIIGYDSDGVHTIEPNIATESETSWSRIISITNNDATDATVSGNILNKDLTEITDFAGELRSLEADDARFTTEDDGTLRNGSVIDALASASIKEVTVTFKTLSKDFEKFFSSGSRYIEVERLNNTPPTADADFADFVALATNGSQDASISASDWDDHGLTPIKNLGVHILVSTSDDIAIHKKFKAHCLESCTLGRERNVWVSAQPNQAVSSVFTTYVKELKDRNTSIVCQSPTWEGENSSSEGWTLAFLCACVQGASNVSEPLTLKRLTRRLQSVGNSNLDLNTDINSAIKNSIVLITPHISGGLQIERSVTTYRADLEHIVYTEVSANESLNACLRDLRASLKTTLGGKASNDQLSIVESLATSRLKKQKDTGIISNFENVTAILDGDTINIGFDLAVMQPQNFINIFVNLI